MDNGEYFNMKDYKLDELIKLVKDQNKKINELSDQLDQLKEKYDELKFTVDYIDEHYERRHDWLED